MRRLGAVVAVGAVVLFMISGCDKTTSQCNGRSCDISVSGKPTVHLGSGSGSGYRRHTHGTTHHGPSLSVRGYQGDAVDISVGGDTRTVRTGQTAVVGGLRVRVESVSGDSAKLHVDY